MDASRGPNAGLLDPVRPRALREVGRGRSGRRRSESQSNCQVVSASVIGATANAGLSPGPFSSQESVPCGVTAVVTVQEGTGLVRVAVTSDLPGLQARTGPRSRTSASGGPNLLPWLRTRRARGVCAPRRGRIEHRVCLSDRRPYRRRGLSSADAARAWADIGRRRCDLASPFCRCCTGASFPWGCLGTTGKPRRTRCSQRCARRRLRPHPALDVHTPAAAPPPDTYPRLPFESLNSPLNSIFQPPHRGPVRTT